MKHKHTTPLIALALVVGTARDVLAQGSIEAAKKQFAEEPAVAEVVEVALKYFRVHPTVLDSLRTQANMRALLPLLATGFRYDDDRFTRSEISMGQPTFDANEDTNSRIGALSVGAVWDLRELVFNPAEVQVFGLIGVQRDIMLEATRTYYLRKQLVLRKIYRPPNDPMASAALDMRIDEFTALLDVLTGGWFSKQASAARDGDDE